jgi:tetratricopeptide (TPR) repeat protein
MASAGQADWEGLFAEAVAFEEAGDVYMAVKLFKKLLRLDVARPEPAERLGRLYFRRQEWKPAFFYLKKSLALQAGRTDLWWLLGIAATALNKLSLAGSVWAKFDYRRTLPPTEGLRLSYEGSFEILWMKPLDPARGQILSIPNPASGFHYSDVVLYHRQPIGHYIHEQQRIPIYDACGCWKKSPYQTFSCLLHTTDVRAIDQLTDMCRRYSVGFERWSGASRTFVPDNQGAFPEFYSFPEVAPANGSYTLAAFAAIHEAEVLHLLNAWQIVSLAAFSDLRAY